MGGTEIRSGHASLNQRQVPKDRANVQNTCVAFRHCEPWDLAGTVHLVLFFSSLWIVMRNSKISTARGALDLRGTVGFLVSAESVMGLGEENSELPYCSFPLTVVSTVSDD